MALTKIISGGQTGADQAGLSAARELRLDTGGMMPKGFLTEDGNRPRFASLYGMTEHPTSDKYPPRTEWNVRNSDGTLIFGQSEEPGSKLTGNICFRFGKPLLVVAWNYRAAEVFLQTRSIKVKNFRLWLGDNHIVVLNVAGNRESTQPGIYRACYDFLLEALL